jgi:NAD(P)-dependent dehydrogenase (short-subunit alcohol dehydrogenase family)
MTAGLAIELAAFNIAVNTLAPVEAVASEGALELGVIDTDAHMEPAEAMAEATLELCSRPPQELSGRIVLSLDLLRELGLHTVRTLDGKATLAGYGF